MCNRLFFSVLLFFFASYSGLYSQNSVRPLYQLSLEEKMEERLYLSTLREVNHPINITGSKEMKLFVMATLGERLPETVYALDQTPEFILKDEEIASELVQVLREETSMGISPSDNENYNHIKGLQLSKNDLASIQFLFAYDLFKRKKFNEALKAFDDVLRYRNEDLEYANYYAGISALILTEYERAEGYLAKIGKDPVLKQHAPYYLALSHYGQKDYQRIIDFYAIRIKDTYLFNHPALVQLLALSHYHQGDWNETLVTLSVLSSLRDLTTEEVYIKGIASKKLGLDQESLADLSSINTSANGLKISAVYEEAMILDEQGKYQEAIASFESLRDKTDINPYDLEWNLLLLHHKTGNFDKSAQIALKLQEKYSNPSLRDYLSKLLDEVQHPEIYKKLTTSLALANFDHDKIKQSIYNRAVTHLKTGDKSAAMNYFNLLSSIFPKIDEHGEIAAWKGIIAYQEGNYSKAKDLLSKYVSSKSTIKTNEQLDFDAQYFLAYCYFKEKNHSKSLGYFGNAFKNLETAYPGSSAKKEDILLRLGDSYFLLNDYFNATAAYEKAGKLNQSNQDYVLYQKAIIADLKSQPYDEIILLDELISNYPSSSYYYKAQYMVANTLFGLGKFDKASNYYNKLIHDEVPTLLREEAILQMGLIYVNAGEFGTAEKYYKQLLASSASNENKGRAHLGLKEIYSDYTYNTEAYLALSTIENEQPKDELLFLLATKNFEEGKYDVAQNQYETLQKDYQNSKYIIQSEFNLAQINISKLQFPEAIVLLEKVVKKPTIDMTLKAYDQLQSIVWERTANFVKYAEIEEQRRKSIPQEEVSLERNYRYSISTLSNFKGIDWKFIETIVAKEELSTQQIEDLLSLAINILVPEQNWKELNTLFILSANGSRKLNPKFVYYNSLTLFNINELERCTGFITSNYETLLSDPAWFAKSIILLSDVYVLHKDLISAKAALQALIESESSIPPSLKTTAQNRLDNLNLQN